MYSKYWLGQPLDFLPGFCDTCLDLLKYVYEPYWYEKNDCQPEMLASLSFPQVGSWSSAAYEPKESGRGVPRAPDASLGRETTKVAEFLSMPRQVKGLCLDLEVVQDTTLIGEPVMMEVSLRNVSTKDERDQCWLNPEYDLLTIYALQTDSTAFQLEPRWHVSSMSTRFLTLPPGAHVGSITLVGCESVIMGGSARGGAEVPYMYFNKPGRYKIFATYLRSEGDDEYEEMNERHWILSNTDSFQVEPPVGADATLLEDVEAGVLIWGSTEDLEEICLEHPASRYRPYLQAKYANSMIVRSPTRPKDYSGAFGALRDLVTAYPGHRLVEEAEFDMAFDYCMAGDFVEANRLLDHLLEEHPDNARAYEVCEGQQINLRLDSTVKAKGGD
jgi:hypothetical protein